MLSAALTRALTTPAFVAADFVPTHWDTSDEKAKFANALLTFVAQDFPRSKFHESFYRRLSNTFGQIANYDSARFYGRFFLNAQDKLEFLEQCVKWPCHGDPTTTYSDVERAVGARLTQEPDRRDPELANRDRAQATGARASFGTQGPLRAGRRGAGKRRDPGPVRLMLGVGRHEARRLSRIEIRNHET
jgi:hypothetical protein